MTGWPVREQWKNQGKMNANVKRLEVTSNAQFAAFTSLF